MQQESCLQAGKSKWIRLQSLESKRENKNPVAARWGISLSSKIQKPMPTEKKPSKNRIQCYRCNKLTHHQRALSPKQGKQIPTKYAHHESNVSEMCTQFLKFATFGGTQICMCRPTNPPKSLWTSMKPISTINQ